MGVDLIMNEEWPWKGWTHTGDCLMLSSLESSKGIVDSWHISLAALSSVMVDFIIKINELV